jgi:hypothetical protein
MKNRVFGRERSVFSVASTCVERAARAAHWPSILLALIIGVSLCSVASADVLDVDLSGATVGGQVPINSQFLPDVAWINFYVDGQYITSTGGSAGSFNWNSSSVGDGVHDIQALGFDAQENVSGYSRIRLSVANSSPSSTPGYVAISGYADQWIGWINLYVDNSYEQSTGSGPWTLSQSFGAGTHQVQLTGFEGNDVVMASAQIGSVNFGGNDPAPTSSSGGSGATIPGLTGSAAGIPWADTNPADYGQYNAPGGWGNGMGLIGGPLLTDAQAASFVVPAQKSTVELSLPCTWCGDYYTPDGASNSAEDNYFNSIASTNPSNYLYQLGASNGFWATASSWGGVSSRIDGACPMANPTTAEVVQWAANKWGINPILLYAEATEEGGWDQNTVGDVGLTAGVLQIADRDSSAQPYHAFAGFAGAGSMLARENTCFNADFFAAHLYAAFHGLTGECPAGDIGTAIETWWGPATSAGGYTALVYQKINTQLWVPLWFQNQQVPY